MGGFSSTDSFTSTTLFVIKLFGFPNAKSNLDFPFFCRVEESNPQAKDLHNCMNSLQDNKHIVDNGENLCLFFVQDNLNAVKKHIQGDGKLRRLWEWILNILYFAKFSFESVHFCEVTIVLSRLYYEIDANKPSNDTRFKSANRRLLYIKYEYIFLLMHTNHAPVCPAEIASYVEYVSDSPHHPMYVIHAFIP